MINWLEVSGGAVGTGSIRDVYFLGSPNNSYMGFDLSQPHTYNHGRGIGFEVVKNYNVNIYASLVGIVVDYNNLYYDWNSYFEYNGTYDWFIKIDYSTNNQQSFNTLFTEQIASHRGNPPQKLGRDWNDTKIEWSKNVTVPTDTTHIKISVYERDRTNFSRDPIFPIEVVIPQIKPYAIRKNNEFLSLNTVKKLFKKRKSNNWLDVSENEKNKIRKGNDWINQSKIGK